jgi:HTH-type transcriptional regulator/antitoxin HigA
MKPKIIRTEADYETALARIDVLMDGDPEPTSAAGEELELLCLLVGNYEAVHYPMDMPSPLEAIKFRMEQTGLKAKDLIPYIGSAPKVSEVLAGKRALSLTMIRKLVNELGIPAEVLLQQEGAKLPSDAAIQQGRHFPVAEMLKRGWFTNFQGTVAEAKSQLEDLLNTFVGRLGPNALIPALNRQHVRNGGNHDEHALNAWRIRVATLALRESLPAYKPGTVNADFLKELARLSYLTDGPKLAKEFLNKGGIHLIFERHLPKTHLDGAALKLPDGCPVVALTLRHDRLDNFWFTLFHELAHVALHLDKDGVEAFFDDLTEGSKKDKCEKEADKLATEALIPEAEWKAAKLTKKSPPAAVLAFAQSLRISPAIPAGRVRYECKSYTVFKPLISTGKLRPMFGIQGN